MLQRSARAIVTHLPYVLPIIAKNMIFLTFSYTNWVNIGLNVPFQCCFILFPDWNSLWSAKEVAL